jgi:hypothetical protein
MQHRTRLIGLFLLLALAINTTFAGVIPPNPPPSNCQLPAPSVTLDYVTPNSAQISWTAIPGVFAYKARLTDVTQSSMTSQDVTVTVINYDNTQIIPGHDYEFVVTPFCGPNDPGTPSVALKFTAPIIVIIDIVERECRPGNQTFDLVHQLPPSIGPEPGDAVGFDLNFNGGVLQFAARATADGNVNFERLPGASLGLDCVPLQSALTGCSSIIIKSADEANLEIASFYASSANGSRYLNVGSMHPDAVLKKCGTRRGLVAPSGVGMDGAASGNIPQDADATDEQAQTIAGSTAPQQGQMQVQAIPNPFSHNLDLRFDLPVSGAVQASLTDITGRQVYHEHFGDALPAGTHNFSISGAALPSGIYVLRVHSAQGVVSCRVVKQ